MILYNYQIFNILLHEIPQMENILISQSKNTNIVIAHKDWKTWVLVVFHPSSASVCLAINWSKNLKHPLMICSVPGYMIS